jgi:hypothetical protein
MFTVTMLVLLAAFVTAVMAGAGKCPLWVSVILLCILEMLQIMPK